jgi:hypothetical protein
MLDEYDADRFPHLAAFVVQFGELLAEHDRGLKPRGKRKDWRKDGFLGDRNSKGEEIPLLLPHQISNILKGKNIPPPNKLNQLLRTVRMPPSFEVELERLARIAREEREKLQLVAFLDLPQQALDLQRQAVYAIGRLRAIESSNRLDSSQKQAKLADEFHKSYPVLDGAGKWAELLEFSEKVEQWHVANKQWRRIYVCFYPRLWIYLERAQWPEVERILLKICEVYSQSGLTEILGLCYLGRADYWFRRYKWDKTERLRDCVAHLVIAEQLLRECPPLHACCLNSRANIYRHLGDLNTAQQDFKLVTRHYTNSDFRYMGRFWGPVEEGNASLLFLEQRQVEKAVKGLRRSNHGITEQSDRAELFIAHAWGLLHPDIQDEEGARISLAYGETLANELGIVFPIGIEHQALLDYFNIPLLNPASNSEDEADSSSPCELGFPLPYL